jgi:hypothetical protein
MGEYYESHSPKAFTSAKLKQMGHSSGIGDPAGTGDRDQTSQSDDYGKPPEISDSSKFKKGGKVGGKGKKMHLGRAGRSTGGRVGRASGGPVFDENETDNDGKKVKSGVQGNVNTQMKSDVGPIRQGEYPKYQRDKRPKEMTIERSGRARGGRTHPDEAEDKALIDKMVKKDARTGRARGGRAKGKTVVNVIVGGKGDQDKPQGGPPMAPMVPPPPPAAPPQPPPHPPGAPMGGGAPPMMPPGGAPMGPAGAPPGGMPPPPMRAKGGRVNNLGKYLHPPKAGFSDGKAPHVGGGKEGFSDTKPTTKRAPMASGSKDFRVKLDPNERAGNNGQGRIEKAARQA